MTRTRAVFATIRGLLADPVVRLVLLTRIVTTGSAPVTVFLVAALRPRAEQGFYFVFANVQAIATLFEYGIGAMLVQFASHASAGPVAAATGSRSGRGNQSVARTLASAQRWFAGAALVVVATVLPGGVALFRQEAVRNHISYAVPWIALTLALGCYLTIIPRICVLEGIGQLRRVQRMRLIQAAVSTACLWSLVPMAGSLTAIAVASIANLLVAAAWLAVSFPAAVRAGAAEQAAPIAAPTSGTSVMRAQNRSAASWIIGFLGPQLLSPIVFRFQGAAAAGQVGLSLAAATAPLMVSLSWLQARYPEYGGLVARGELDLLDSTAKRATAQALAVCGVSIVVLLLLVLWVQLFFARLGSRFLPIGGVAALCLTSIVYLLYQAMAGHLRAHREESLLWPIALGTSASIAATIAAARYGPMAAALSYSASVIGVLLPASIVGFVRRRRLLHFAHARDRQSGWESLPPSEESTPNGP